MLKFLGIWAAVMAIVAAVFWLIVVTKGMVVLGFIFILVTLLIAMAIHLEGTE